MIPSKWKSSKLGANTKQWSDSKALILFYCTANVVWIPTVLHKYQGINVYKHVPSDSLKIWTSSIPRASNAVSHTTTNPSWGSAPHVSQQLTILQHISAQDQEWLPPPIRLPHCLGPAPVLLLLLPNFLAPMLTMTLTLSLLPALRSDVFHSLSVLGNWKLMAKGLSRWSPQNLSNDKYTTSSCSLVISQANSLPSYSLMLIWH